MSAEYEACSICKAKYKKYELYSCCNNHIFCPPCYRSQYHKTNERKCPNKDCYSWVKMSPRVACKSNQPKKMFPQSQVVEKKKSVTTQNSILSMYRAKSVSAYLLSRKPVYCPHINCNKTVAVSAFDSHFNHEHPKVQVIHTYLENRNGMEIYLNKLAYNTKNCIARLNLLESGNDINLLDYESKNGEIIKPCLIVLAARLPPTFDDSSPCYSSDDSISEDSFDESTFTIDDKLLIWLASNIQTDLSYTVAISTICNRIMMKYFGPLVTLDMETKDLMMEGKGLIVSGYQYLGMTNNLQKHLVLNVLVHGKD